MKLGALPSTRLSRSEFPARFPLGVSFTGVPHRRHEVYYGGRAR